MNASEQQANALFRRVFRELLEAIEYAEDQRELSGIAADEVTDIDAATPKRCGAHPCRPGRPCWPIASSCPATVRRHSTTYAGRTATPSANQAIPPPFCWMCNCRSAWAGGLGKSQRRPGTSPDSRRHVDFVTEERDLVRKYDLRVNAFVVKPVDFNAFFEAIRDLGVLTEPPPHGARPAP